MQKDDFVSIEIHELDKKNPLSPMELIPASANLPPPFDFERLTRFMAYGFMMSPVQFHWFAFLSKAFPVTKHSGLIPVLKRVAFDQLMFAPVGKHLLQTRKVNFKTVLSKYRSCMFLYFYDSRRRRWTAGCDSEVPRRLCSSSEGELHGLASCAAP